MTVVFLWILVLLDLWTFSTAPLRILHGLIHWWCCDYQVNNFSKHKTDLLITFLIKPETARKACTYLSPCIASVWWQEGVWPWELYLSHTIEQHEGEGPEESHQLPSQKDSVPARATPEGRYQLMELMKECAERAFILARLCCFQLPNLTLNCLVHSDCKYIDSGHEKLVVSCYLLGTFQWACHNLGCKDNSKREGDGSSNKLTFYYRALFY